MANGGGAVCSGVVQCAVGWYSVLLVQMAPDYDHLCLMQKVEVFEHALEHTQGDDLAKILWYKSPGSEVSRLSAAVLSVVLLLLSYQWSFCCCLISGPSAAVLSVALLLLSYQWSFCCCLISGPSAAVLLVVLLQS